MHAHVKKTSRMKTQETQYLQHFNAFRGRGRDVSCLTPPRTDPYVHLYAYGLYGAFFVKGRHAILVVLCIPFFCSTRAASILPSRPHISIAVARSGGQGRRFFSAAEGLSLTDASTAAGCRRSDGWPRDDPN